MYLYKFGAGYQGRNSNLAVLHESDAGHETLPMQMVKLKEITIGLRYYSTMSDCTHKRQGRREHTVILSQLCYGPVVTYCMVYHYTKRVTLARLLANKGPAIYVVHLNRYFVIPP